MKNIALINGIDLALPHSGRSSMALVFPRALDYRAGFPDVAETVVFLSRARQMPRGMHDPSIRASWTVAELLAEMAAGSGGMRSVFYFYADCPFLDLGLARTDAWRTTGATGRITPLPTDIPTESPRRSLPGTRSKRLAQV